MNLEEGESRGRKKAWPLTHDDGHRVSQMQGEASEGLTQEQAYPEPGLPGPSPVS